jgi:UMF1 family MFS transporter
VTSSENSAYGITIVSGPLDGKTILGKLHPSRLGDGPVDWWPVIVRNVIWKPLGFTAEYQWILLGVSVGLVMGGSQALSRSLFAQMTPETRSGEFFSFFGFMSRASTVFGPMMYVIVTSFFDTRIAVTSILLIILAGTVMLNWVDVKAGIIVADEEDRKALD